MTAPVAPQQFRPQPPHQGPPAPPDPTPRPDRGPLIQRVLLGAGALCVLVAGAVYLAVSWHRIGTAGQSGLALLVTAVAALAAHLLARRGLRTSAEALALVAAGLLALDLAGAHHLDVLGAARMPWWAWLTVAAGVVLVVTAALALLDRLAAYRVVAVAALAVVPFTALAAVHAAGVEAAAGVTTVVAAAVAAALVGLAVALGRRDALAALTAAVGAAGWWLAAAGAGVVAAGSSRPYADVLPTAVVWAGIGAVGFVRAGRAIAGGRTGDAAIVVSVLGPIAALPAVPVLAGAVTGTGPVGAVVTAVGVAALWATPWAATPAGRPLALGAAAVAVLLVPVGVGRGFGFDLTALLVLLVGVAAAGGVWHGRGVSRVLAAVGALGAAVAAGGLFAVDRAAPAMWLCVAWTVIAMLAVVAATFVAAARDGLLAAGAAVGVLAAAAGLAAQLLDTRSPALVLTLVGLGTAALVHGAVRISRPVVLVGAAILATAAVDLAAIARVGAVEAFTLPIAAVALVAGILARVGRPERSSWVWTAPAVLAATVPSTAVVLTDPGVVRLVALAAAAALLTVLGHRFRLAAPLVLGAATEAVLAVSQLAPYAVGAPRWVTLALAGVLLLTLGVLFERARRGAAAAGRWYTALR